MQELAATVSCAPLGINFGRPIIVRLFRPVRVEPLNCCINIRVTRLVTVPLLSLRVRATWALCSPSPVFTFNAAPDAAGSFTIASSPDIQFQNVKVRGTNFHPMCSLQGPGIATPLF